MKNLWNNWVFWCILCLVNVAISVMLWEPMGILGWLVSSLFCVLKHTEQ